MNSSGSRGNSLDTGGVQDRRVGSRTARLCFIGDAMVDIVADVDGLAQGGVVDREVNMVCGGTANVAVWACRGGLDTAFIGRVGCDAMGQMFQDDLEETGVVGLLAIDDELPTGLCLSLIENSKERSMVVQRGANSGWTRHEFEQRLDSLSGWENVFMTGYMMKGIEAELLSWFACELKRRNCEIWFNPGAYNLVQPEMVEFIKIFVDGLILNLEEAHALVQGQSEAISAALRPFAKTIVITKGDQGSLAITRHAVYETPASSVPQVKDTTGAGDAFAGGFLSAWLSGSDIRSACERGHQFAGQAIGKSGAR